MKFLGIAMLVVAIVGCNSTPYNDDYAKHHNSLSTKDKSKALTFTLFGDNTVDLRGIYNSDDTADNTNVMYAGDAGIAGMLIQIGVHAAIKNEQRNARLDMLQAEANANVSSLINKARGIETLSLTGHYKSRFKESESTSENTVHVKPIFFSNAQKDKLHMRMVAWIPKANIKSKKGNNFRYRNSIQVFTRDLDEQQVALLEEKDSGFLKKQLADLMQIGLYMISKDIDGTVDAQITLNKSKHKTYLVGTKNPKVYRAKLVEQRCEFQIVKDLRSWLIAFQNEREEKDTLAQLNDSSTQVCVI